MKKIFKKLTKCGKKIYKKIQDELKKETNVDVRVGHWMNLYYPVGGDCFYVVGGKVIKRKNKIDSLNQKIRLRTRLSRERTDIDMPTQGNHFLVKS